MSHVRHFDVIVAGAGPAGSSCATMLARAGLNVLLIDRSRFPRDKICGDCINPGCWSFFDAMGVSDALRSLNPRILRSIRIVTPRKTEIAINIPGDDRRPFFSIRRSELDYLLMRTALEAGTAFLEEATILDAIFDGGWNVLVRDKNGNASYRCTYLVGADGRNSALAAKIGAWSKSNPTARGKRRVGIQCQTKYLSSIGSEVCLGTMQYGYFGVVNISDDCANIAMVVNADDLRSTYRDLSEFFEEMVCEHPIIGWSIAHAGHFDKIVTTFPVSPVRRYWIKPQAFLAGDARQTVEPFTGEGIFFALQDGFHTAEEILRAYGKRNQGPLHPHRYRWANRVFSPILNHSELAESVLGYASHAPWLARALARKVFWATSA